MYEGSSVPLGLVYHWRGGLVGALGSGGHGVGVREEALPQISEGCTVTVAEGKKVEGGEGDWYLGWRGERGALLARHLCVQR